MKFTLTYDGPLRSSGNKPKNRAKWNIRKKLHPQLNDLWTNHPALRGVYENRHFPKSGGATIMQDHHLHLGSVHPPASIMSGDVLDLCESWFRPLVRESYALHCGLKILFLRKEPPGKVYQGGDIDGRIKTLIDALTMPQHVEQVFESNDNKFNHIYCLLEEDYMLSGLNIESERLLTDENHPVDYARLTIEVDVRVRQTTIYNQSFLG